MPNTNEEMLAVDDNAIRRTDRKATAHTFLQILSVYATESGVTLASKAIEYKDKTSEIPVFKNIPDDLDIEGKTTTSDALYRQKETCAKILSKKGKLLFGTKATQPVLYDNIKHFFSNPINDSSMTTLERNGGRIEKQICHISDDIG